MLLFIVAKNVKTKICLLINIGCGSGKSGSATVGSDWESSRFRITNFNIIIQRILPFSKIYFSVILLSCL